MTTYKVKAVSAAGTRHWRVKAISPNAAILKALESFRQNDPDSFHHVEGRAWTIETISTVSRVDPRNGDGPSINHAAKVLGVTPHTMQRWLNSGLIPLEKIPKSKQQTGDKP